MSRPRSGANKALVAIGIVSSICAVTATYLYFSTNTASVSSFPRRRKIMISAGSVQEVLDFLPPDAPFENEVYIALYNSGDKDTAEEDILQEHCSYFLRHEKVVGLTHISRHVSPDVVILLPSMSSNVKIDDIKDWVGKVALISDAASEAAGNVRHFLPRTTYAEVLTSV